MKKRIKTSILSILMTAIMIATTVCFQTDAFAFTAGKDSTCTAKTVGEYKGSDGQYYGHGSSGSVVYKYFVLNYS